MNNSTSLPIPKHILFDWHGTLVDTQDAMIAALEEMLPQLEELHLIDRLQPEEQCLNKDDEKLVRYIRLFRRLHPKILAERRNSRTEIFNAIFGDDTDAKNLAHRAYNKCYRNYFGKVKPFQQGVREYLASIKRLGITIGVATNRSREFFQHELRTVDDGSWPRLVDLSTCADDVTYYKPDPQVIRYALAQIDTYPRPETWYIGDSYLDIVTGREAGVTAIFYNGGCRTPQELKTLFGDDPRYQPDAIINSFEELMDLLEAVQRDNPSAFEKIVSKARPPAFPAPEPPPQHIEPDWHPSVAQLIPPSIILFDWHATLVDTLDAMYRAVDDMLPELGEHGLLQRMVDPQQSKSPDDARLVDYVRQYAQLHPKIKADRKISRTDIFEVLFGEDMEAKQIAHKIFNQHYRNHFGTVLPFEPQVRSVLVGLKALGLQLGVITNRDREFFEHEVQAVENGTWADLFDTMVCGDDTVNRKPHPDQLIESAAQLGREPAMDIWYVGDSTTDIIASKVGGFTGVFFNGAQWDLNWLHTIFPGNQRYPHKPDVVVNDFSEFWALVLACLRNAR
ncbi:MAG: HAD family hydrolase [Pseudomonadales bacterium]|jgi:phosphoglycolate phosphatase|uniref:HAD family hydrolase n=1 Tax=unclassified Ketobacter TaxID=2639109 RepID=UPI000C92F2B1|nr:MULTISPECIES: HAD family hydrolase [unclassified Ketobacter]MAA58540.1 HAD family hydrolase [Pseudomonadales bacterium]MEC8812559.1 HAD family hydrolase [Pseudomonadota bacterium]TNC86769.1 MAG: HAD family hydrolase [Alcanivorax sp.]HBO92117.1 HAD family hydrolase [Gammaproteobacteria bacterium]MAQ23381.1 HAD family hydrolase [Pseudomonadales bacterium]|tara:strand:- start:722 stop:2413 length:1692 start_codon:yes stop_codon:yes gene_type:complete